MWDPKMKPTHPQQIDSEKRDEVFILTSDRKSL